MIATWNGERRSVITQSVSATKHVLGGRSITLKDTTDTDLDQMSTIVKGFRCLLVEALMRSGRVPSVDTPLLSGVIEIVPISTHYCTAVDII